MRSPRQVKNRKKHAINRPAGTDRSGRPLPASGPGVLEAICVKDLCARLAAVFQRKESCWARTRVVDARPVVAGRGQRREQAPLARGARREHPLAAGPLKTLAFL